MRWKFAQWIEIRWWKKYLSDKEVDSYLQWKRTYWTSFLSEIQLSVPIGSKILDAGCGPAGIFTILKDQEVDAIDPLLDQYEAQIDVFNPEVYPWVSFRCMELEALTDQECFDQVFCLNVINHVRRFDRSLDALTSALKSNGNMVLSIDCHRYALLKWVFRLIPGDILHPHQHALEDYENALIERGLTIDRRVRLKRGNLFDYYAVVATKN